MSAFTAASDDEMQAEIERLRAENAGLKQQLAQRVPDGWKLVPVEPTQSMIYEGNRARLYRENGDLREPAVLSARTYNTKQAWAAMLSAAPAQPEQPAAPAGTPAAFPWPLKTDRPAAQDEPVMIYHGRCIIDCGEHGHQDVEMLKMIPAGTKLYTRQQPASKPMTLDQAAEIAKQLGWDSMPGSFPMIVRAVERFYNIKE